MMKNHDQSVKISHNPNWPYIRDHPCRILIIGGSGSGKPDKTSIKLNKTSTTIYWQIFFIFQRSILMKLELKI